MPRQYAYSFTKFSNNIIRPIVPIRLINPFNHKKIFVYCLLDTGADKCIFPADFATSLDHDLKNKDCKIEENIGVGGKKVTAYLHTFKINLLSPDRKQIVWKSKEIEIGCLDNNDFPGLVGYSGFLEYMNIRFNYRNYLAGIQK